MFPLHPFVQYTLACLHVAPGQVTPNMLRQILGTGVLFRLLGQEFPNFEEFNACWHMAYCTKKGSRGCVTLKSRGKFKILVEDLPTSTSKGWRRKCFLVWGQWQEWHGHPFRVPGAFQRIVPQEYELTELMERQIRRVLWAFECRSSYRICRLCVYSHFGYARVLATMPRDGGSRKKEGPYDRVSDEDVLDGLLAEATHAKCFDIDLETGEGKEVELEECEDDFLRLNLADEDYAYVPPLVAKVMGLGDQEVGDEVAEIEGGDPESDQELVLVGEEHVSEPVGMGDAPVGNVGEPETGDEDLITEKVEPLEQESEEVVVTKTRKRKERMESSRDGQAKRSRKEGRFGSSRSLAEITHALEGIGEAQPYLAQMAYDMRHRSCNMNALEEVEPLAGMALAKEKLTRATLLMYAASERAVTHLQGDAEVKCQQLKEAEENNRALSQRLEQVEQDAAVFRDQATTAGKEVAVLKEAMQEKDKQVEAGEVAAAKVASLEAEVARLNHALVEQERVWKLKCARAAGAGERVFRESDMYKQQLKSAYNRGQDELSKTGWQAGWIDEAVMRKFYAERDAAKKAWELMTPEQRKQAKISRSLAKQHESWRATSSVVPKEGLALKSPRPEGSPAIQVVVSQVASFAIEPHAPRGPGLAPPPRAEVSKVPVSKSPTAGAQQVSSLVRPNVSMRPPPGSRGLAKHTYGQRVSVNISQSRGQGSGSKSSGSVNKSSGTSSGEK